MFIQKPKGWGEKVTLFKGAVSGERVGAAHRPVCGARPAAMATGAHEAKGAEMPLKEALRFARSSSYRSDLLPGPGDHTWRRSAARGVLSPGNGPKRPFVVQRELFLISKMCGFLPAKERNRKYAFPSVLCGCWPARAGEAGASLPGGPHPL